MWTLIADRPWRKKFQDIFEGRVSDGILNEIPKLLRFLAGPLGHLTSLWVMGWKRVQPPDYLIHLWVADFGGEIDNHCVENIDPIIRQLCADWLVDPRPLNFLDALRFGH